MYAYMNFPQVVDVKIEGGGGDYVGGGVCDAIENKIG